MKRLLKIKEFFNLKKRDSDANSYDSSRPAKRARKGARKDDGSSTSSAQTPLRTAQKGYDKFLQAFESEAAKDSVWWLPGRRGEAFALHKERFEHSLLKIHFQQHDFSDFLADLKRWGFKQMNIPSLSGRVLTFEKSSVDCSSNQEKKELRDGHRPRHHLSQLHTLSPSRLTAHSPAEAAGTEDVSQNITNSLGVVQLQQAHYMVHQEIASTYFSLLWQELQRQLSVLLVQQTQMPPDSAQATVASAPGSEILYLAALLHQQQVQQQLMAAQFIHAAFVQPTTQAEQEGVVREVNELQQQQLSNLTYQIIALVAANLEHQNQNPPAAEAPMIHRILIKYMIALVLLQLQQQQQNLEFLRQERLTALIRSINSGATTASDGSLPDPLNTLQMQQLLSEAAMLSLSRAHQLLCEAAVLIPEYTSQTTSPGHQSQTQNQHDTPPAFSGAGFSQGPPTRTTTAR